MFLLIDDLGLPGNGIEVVRETGKESCMQIRIERFRPTRTPIIVNGAQTKTKSKTTTTRLRAGIALVDARAQATVFCTLKTAHEGKRKTKIVRNALKNQARASPGTPLLSPDAVVVIGRAS